MTVICMSDQLLYKVLPIIKASLLPTINFLQMRVVFIKASLCLRRHFEWTYFFHQHLKYRSCTQFVDKASFEYWNGVFVHAFEYPLFRCWV